LAEKRKSLLDELAIKYQQESNEHREQLKTMTRQHQSEVEQLNKQIDELMVSNLSSNKCWNSNQWTVRICQITQSLFYRFVAVLENDFTFLGTIFVCHQEISK